MRGQPIFVGVPAVATALGVHQQTIRMWIKRGELAGVQLQVGPHDCSEQPRRTPRGRWLVEMDSVTALLERLYRGRPVPDGIARRLRDIQPSTWPGVETLVRADGSEWRRTGR